jgi:hypothetical protein
VARREKKAMKNILLTIAFAAASLPMFAAQTPAPAASQPAAGTPATKTATKPKKVKKAKVKKTNKDASKTTPAPAAK